MNFSQMDDDQINYQSMTSLKNDVKNIKLSNQNQSKPSKFIKPKNSNNIKNNSPVLSQNDENNIVIVNSNDKKKPIIMKVLRDNNTNEKHISIESAIPMDTKNISVTYNPKTDECNTENDTLNSIIIDNIESDKQNNDKLNDITEETNIITNPLKKPIILHNNHIDNVHKHVDNFIVMNLKKYYMYIPIILLMLTNLIINPFMVCTLNCYYHVFSKLVIANASISGCYCFILIIAKCVSFKSLIFKKIILTFSVIILILMLIISTIIISAEVFNMNDYCNYNIYTAITIFNYGNILCYCTVIIFSFVDLVFEINTIGVYKYIKKYVNRW